MARPIKKGLDYFSHDVDMSEDLKIKKLENKFGLTGYAVYNKILEQQYKYAGEFNLITDDNLSLYAREWKITRPRLLEIIKACIELRLFTDESLLSDAIKNRMEKINHKRAAERVRKIPKKTLNEDNNNLTEVIKSENTADTPESKVKESKEKKSSVCTHTHDFENFHSHFKTHPEYKTYKDYDLQYYFSRVLNFYCGKKFSEKELQAKVIFFIDNDKKSEKHSPVKNPVKKKDTVTVAYELVHENLEWIKSLPDKNPDEVIPVIASRCREPARHDPLFEAYIEKALRAYNALN
jgi:hypothetical protein